MPETKVATSSTDTDGTTVSPNTYTTEVDVNGTTIRLTAHYSDDPKLGSHFQNPSAIRLINEGLQRVASKARAEVISVLSRGPGVKMPEGSNAPATKGLTGVIQYIVEVDGASREHYHTYSKMGSNAGHSIQTTQPDSTARTLLTGLRAALTDVLPSKTS